MKRIFDQIESYKIVPVIKLECADDAIALGEALCMGGLPVMEITFRTSAAAESIKRIAKSLPNILLGAGTITNVEQVKQAVDAGASFIVTPGFHHKIAEYCVSNHIPVTLGTCTPTEIMYLLEYGLNVAKFFPAEQFGGIQTIKALCAPFPSIRFIPTGGIHEGNLLDYLAIKSVVACGGSWMVKDELIKSGDFAAVTSRTREAMKLVSSKSM